MGTRHWLHALLFVATCLTVYFIQGLEFALTLIAILITHEMGHYLVARRHRVDVSLPYFIPVPFSMGTLGAVIRMKSPITRRDALMDIGAAGPLAGMCVALPLLVIGLAQSKVAAIETDPNAVAFVEGNSILYILLKLAIKGQYLPAGGIDVILSPMAMAAWVGLLLTFINLLPIGQLDGGHVAVAYFGDRHERRALWLHRGLIVIASAIVGSLFVEARSAGRDAGEALSYAIMAALPWLIWAALLALMRRMGGGSYHPPVGDEPLSPSRRRLFWVVAVLFVLIFTPVPMREAL
jgi:membrane-associated protease RseP (regulator of RpoE activity)